MLILWLLVSLALPANKARTVLNIVNLLAIIALYAVLSYFFVDSVLFQKVRYQFLIWQSVLYMLTLIVL